jgi:DNA-directed RNA polymerase subunit K/omega
MKFKNTGAEKSTITRDVNEFIEKTDNIFKVVSVMAKRSAQVNDKMKEELMDKLQEFAVSQDQLDEVFENQEQIAVSKFYESLPKPWAIATKEFLNDEIYMRDTETEVSAEDSNQDA